MFATQEREGEGSLVIRLKLFLGEDVRSGIFKNSHQCFFTIHHLGYGISFLLRLFFVCCSVPAFEVNNISDSGNTGHFGKEAYREGGLLS